MTLIEQRRALRAASAVSEVVDLARDVFITGSGFRLFLGVDGTTFFGFGWAEFDSASLPKNQVFNLGINCDEYGNAKNALLPVLRDSWESRFDTGAVVLEERHVQSSYLGIDRRHWSTSRNEITHAVDNVFSGELYVFDSTGAANRLTLTDVASPSSVASAIWNGAIHLMNFVAGDARAIRFLTANPIDYIDAFGRGASDDFVLVGGPNGTGVKLRQGTNVKLVAEAAGVALGAAGSYGGGVGVVSIPNAVTVPASNPTGGGVLYVEAGVLKYRGSSGTVTTLGAA